MSAGLTAAATPSRASTESALMCERFIVATRSSRLWSADYFFTSFAVGNAAAGNGPIFSTV